MSITLRHKKFPFIVVYNDPKEGWDEFVKEKILEEIKEHGFDKFTLVNDATGLPVDKTNESR